MKKRTFLKTAGLTLVGCGALGNEYVHAESKPMAAAAAPGTLINQDSKVIARNMEAVNDILSSKKHFAMHSTGWRPNSATNLFTLAHLSDIHTDSKRYRNFAEFVNGVDYINAAIGTGDFVIAGEEKQFAYMKSVKFNKDFIKVVGNHERARTENTRAFVYKQLGLNTNTGKLYYYQDYPEYKIRIIVLNQYDTDESAAVNPNEHYSQEQIDWLIDVLKDSRQKDFAVMIAMHAPFMEKLPKSNNKGFYQRQYSWMKFMDTNISGPIIEEIVNAFKHGSSIRETYSYVDMPDMKVTVDASFSGNGTFIAYLSGHEHGDFIGYSTFFPDQLHLNMNVSCCMPEFADYNFGEEVSDLARVEGTVTEDCFNVYSFDIENKLVKVVRVGSSVNDLMEDRKKACYTFEGI